MEKQPFGRLRRRRGDNIKMDLTKNDVMVVGGWKLLRIVSVNVLSYELNKGRERHWELLRYSMGYAFSSVT